VILAASKYFIGARRTCAACLTPIRGALTAAFDLLFFRRVLKAQLKTQRQQISILTGALRAATADETTARAQLCRLRVVPESPGGRTGFMVSAFVPTDVLNRLKNSTQSEQDAYRDSVVKVLVNRAMAGLYRVTARGNMVATVFEPIGSKVGITMVFETKDGKHVAQPIPAASPEIRLIREIEQFRAEIAVSKAQSALLDNNSDPQ
jgi:hypothetical protein